jgi:hypothetical protein
MVRAESTEQVTSKQSTEEAFLWGLRMELQARMVTAWRKEEGKKKQRASPGQDHMRPVGLGKDSDFLFF